MIHASKEKNRCDTLRRLAPAGSSGPLTVMGSCLEPRPVRRAAGRSIERGDMTSFRQFSNVETQKQIKHPGDAAAASSPRPPRGSFFFAHINPGIPVGAGNLVQKTLLS
jgi:hypothetical protein